MWQSAQIPHYSTSYMLVTFYAVIKCSWRVRVQLLVRVAIIAQNVQDCSKWYSEI